MYGAQENGRHIEHVTKSLKDAFPNTKIFPLSGNHEPDICNMYPPTSLKDKFNLDWMYGNITTNFMGSMGPDAVLQFMKAGFYTVKAKDGLRLVFLNTNLCYVQNFWLPYEPRDPEGQLQWFADTMLAAEKANEHVYIIAHISPGSGSCWPVWSEQYDRIMTRFGHLVRAQFHGHSHREYFVLTFDQGTLINNWMVNESYI